MNGIKVYSDNGSSLYLITDQGLVMTSGPKKGMISDLSLADAIIMFDHKYVEICDVCLKAEHDLMCPNNPINFDSVQYRNEQ